MLRRRYGRNDERLAGIARLEAQTLNTCGSMIREERRIRRVVSLPLDTLTAMAELIHKFGMKASRQVEGARPRRRKSAAATTRAGAPAGFIGTRPRRFPMTLRGEAVDVEVVPAVATATHVNFAIVITRRGKILDWKLTRAELESIGRTAGMHARQETRQ